MRDNDTTDVLIIGAGPTGLALACDLARRKVPHRIIERATEPSVASRAKTIQPRALEVLDDLGAAARIVERGVVDLPTRYHDASGAVTDKPGLAVRADNPAETPFPDPVWIAEFDVEAALREQHARAGGRVEFGTEATGLRQDDDGVTIDVATRSGVQTIRARYVVAADGGKSRIPKIVDLPLVGETYENQKWYLGDVRAPGLDRGHIHIWTSEQGMLGLTPLPSTDIWQLQSPIPAEVTEPAEPSLELYQAMLDDRAGAGAVTLTSATWLSVYRVNVRMVERYRNGRVFFAGDAAHVHSPAGGQGMNTGIQDAYNLGWKLAAVLGGADAALLDSYEEERLPVARAVLTDSTRKMQRTSGTVTGTSDGGLSAALGDLSDDLTSGLMVAYPSSPLTQPFPGERTVSPRPGDRAPDATGLRGPGGFDSSVFDLIRGLHWTILEFSDDSEPPLPGNLDEQVRVYRILHQESSTVPDDAIVDSRGAAYRAYSPEGDELVLIRPDGYIAARSSTQDALEIADHLSLSVGTSSTALSGLGLRLGTSHGT